MNEQDVRALQTLVGAKIDGDFGILTKGAVVEYMKNLAGPEVWAELQKGDSNVAIKWKQAALTALAGLTAITVGLVVAKSPRDKVVSAALKELGVQNPDKYWSVVQPRLVKSDKAWCGGFALWALKQAGLANDMVWNIGRGFAEVYKLPKTKNPQPGDIVYYDQPLQHHAIVKKNNGDGTVDTIDGNQAGETVKIKQRISIQTPTAFYSIEPLLKAG